jgi:GNAT superfamily N-acetyltransferase
VWEEDRAVLEAHPDALGVALDAIAQRRARVAVGESGELLGFSVVANGGREVCELDDLFVDSDVWRQGVGRALVEVAAARGAAAGSQRMTVVAHPRNFPFYESVGFVPGEPAQTPSGRRCGCGANSREAATGWIVLLLARSSGTTTFVPTVERGRRQGRRAAAVLATPPRGP